MSSYHGLLVSKIYSVNRRTFGSKIPLLSKPHPPIPSYMENGRCHYKSSKMKDSFTPLKPYLYTPCTIVDTH